MTRANLLAAIFAAGVVLGCATAEKVLTTQRLQDLRSATRQICADLAEADRLAGMVLDDGGVADSVP